MGPTRWRFLGSFDSQHGTSGTRDISPRFSAIRMMSREGSKVGGILARAVPFHGRLEGIIVGIGINVPCLKNKGEDIYVPGYGGRKCGGYV